MTENCEHCEHCADSTHVENRVPSYQGSFTTTYDEWNLEVSIDWKWCPGTITVYAAIIVTSDTIGTANEQTDDTAKTCDSILNFAVHQVLSDDSARCNVCAVRQRCIEEVVNPAITNFLEDLHNACPTESNT